MNELDTAPEARRVQIAVLRRMTPQQRVEAAVSMSEDSREIALTGIRSRHPDWDEARVRHELLIALYGAELATRAWGSA